MYSATREEAAEVLGVSVRSVDRYIKSWKLRAEKEWKSVMIHKEDIDALKKWPSTKQEIITPKRKVETVDENVTTTAISTEIKEELTWIYDDLKNTIEEKDLKIAELSFKLGKMEEVVKNSISMIEFNKSQLKLEEAKEVTENKLKDVLIERDEITSKYKDEKSANIILIIVSLLLLWLLIYVWYLKL